MWTSDQLFRDLCERAHDLIQCVSPEGKLLYVNRAWLDRLGYERDEITRLTVFDIIHPDSREHCARIFDELLGGGSAPRLEADFRTRDGVRVSVEGSIRAREEDGRVAWTQGIFRDVTERKQTKEQLNRLFDLSLDLLCVAGTDGYFKQINPAFERVLGYSRDELLSRQFIEFVHPDDREDTLREVDNLAQGKPVVDFRNRYRARNGEWRWLAWRAAPVAEQGLIYAVARDITEEKRSQELLARQAAELKRSNSELEQFAYVASHDLRSPLRAIHDLAEWLEDDLPQETSEKARMNLQRLRTRVDRLERLIDDLLHYSQAGRVRGQIREVDVAAMIEALREMLSPPEGFVVEGSGELPVFETDAPALEQVLRNLVGNALKHHDRSSGRVTISASDVDEGYEFVVEDDGPGIPEEHHDRVFQMFQKLESRDRVEGTGLGLALVKRVVEGHGGQIRLESEGKRGLTVRFRWQKRVDYEDAQGS